MLRVGGGRQVSGLEMRWSGRVLALAIAATGLPLLSTSAFASAGCDAVNAHGFDNSITNAAINQQINGSFAAGDKITFDITINGPNPFWILLSGNTSLDTTNATGTRSYTVTGNSDTSLRQVLSAPGGTTLNITATCVPANAGMNNSQLLEQTRQTFSKIGAQTSSQAMGDATSGAISDAFSDGGRTQVGNGQISTSFAAIENAQNADTDKKRDPFESFNALGYAKAPYAKAPPLIRSQWHAWIDARFTGFEDKSAASFDGWHNNFTGGASYRFTDNFLAGVLVGYENSKYSMTAFGTPASLKGEGVSGGGYFGWKFYDRLRLDGMLTYGRINYDAAAGPVTGSFGADRLTGMSKLSGRYGFGAFYLEPSAMLTIASERQDGFTDTAAVLHDKFNFVVGRASTGGTIGVPMVWGATIVTPTFGVFGDYRFGDETAAALSAVPTFNNGWSAHVNGGLSFAMANGLTASATGEYGGLGQDLTYWRARGSLGMKF